MSRLSSKIGLVMAVALLAACDDSTEITGPPGTTEDRAAIQAIVDELDAAWSAGNPSRYAAVYAGAEWVGPTGVVTSDLAAITGTYTFLFNVALPGTQRKSNVRNVTFLSPTVAVIDIDARITGVTNPPPTLVPWQPGVMRAMEKNVLTKNQQWRIMMHQQTFAAPGTP